MNIGILTSGGDAPGMNAFLSIFVKTAIKEKFNVYAVKFGYQGLIDNKIYPLSKKDIDNIFHLGGSSIKSFRSPEFQTKKGFLKAIKNYKKNNLDCLVILGGDGSLKGVNELINAGIPVIFIASTIDNDLCYTDKALGFDSAVNCAVEQIDKIKQTMLSLNRVFICEVMGRKCPDIANHCAMATNADVLIANNKDYNIDKIVKTLKTSIKNGEEAPLIILKENITNAGNLAKEIQNKLDIETRASILGYVQRGTAPSVYDRIYAKKLANYTISQIKKSEFNSALGINNNEIRSTRISVALTANSRTYDDLTIS